MLSVAMMSREHRLETQNLRLEPVSSGDLEDYRKLLTDPAVMRFVGIEAGRIPGDEEIAEIVESSVEAWTTRGWGRWSAFEKSSGEFAGFVGFRSEEGAPELMTVLHEKFWGKGYASEASRACVEYGIRSLGFEEIFAFARPENRRARSMLERLGAEFEGVVTFHEVAAAKYRWTKSDLERA